MDKKPLVRLATRLNINFSFIQCFYWISTVTFSSMATVLLRSKGLETQQIGLTVTFTAVSAMIFQTLISDYADKHPQTPLKYIIIMVYSLSIVFSALLIQSNLSILLVGAFYVFASSFESMQNAFLSALIVEPINRGIPASYGVPRAIGSFSFCVMMVVVGRLVDQYSPDILVPFHICFTFLAIVCTMIFPRIDKLKIDGIKPPQRFNEKAPSMAEMFRSNKTLRYFLLACFPLFTARMFWHSFLIDLIQAKGGSVADLGIAMMVHGASEVPFMFFSKKLATKFGVSKLLMVSAIALTIETFFLMVAPTVGLIITSKALTGLGTGIFLPVSVQFMNEISSEQEKVRAQSMVAIFSTNAGRVFGPLIGGSLIASFGIYQTMRYSLFFGTIGSALLILSVLSHMKRSKSSGQNNLAL